VTRSVPHHLRRCSCGRGVFVPGPARTCAPRPGRTSACEIRERGLSLPSASRRFDPLALRSACGGRIKYAAPAGAPPQAVRDRARHQHRSLPLSPLPPEQLWRDGTPYAAGLASKIMKFIMNMAMSTSVPIVCQWLYRLCQSVLNSMSTLNFCPNFPVSYTLLPVPEWHSLFRRVNQVLFSKRNLDSCKDIIVL